MSGPNTNDSILPTPGEVGNPPVDRLLCLHVPQPEGRLILYIFHCICGRRTVHSRSYNALDMSSRAQCIYCHHDHLNTHLTFRNTSPEGREKRNCAGCRLYVLEPRYSCWSCEKMIQLPPSIYRGFAPDCWSCRYPIDSSCLLKWKIAKAWPVWKRIEYGMKILPIWDFQGMEVCDEPVISKELMELRYPELDPGTLFGHTLVHMSDEWEIATGEERKYDFLEVSPYIPEE